MLFRGNGHPLHLSMKKPSRPRYVALLNAGQRAVERWVQEQGDAQVSLTAPQAGVLFFLSSNDGALIGDVAQALGVGAPAMSTMADRLARYGFIERSRDGNDARATRVYLTEQGRMGARRAKVVLAQMNERFGEGFSPAEMDVVARWLQALPEKFSPAAGQAPADDSVA